LSISLSELPPSCFAVIGYFDGQDEWNLNLSISALSSLNNPQKLAESSVTDFPITRSEMFLGWFDGKSGVSVDFMDTSAKDG
jgi:hypothetical protein